MLARPSLRDHALLAHPTRQQRLPEGVVDLVCPGVQQVFTLQINLRPTTVLCEPLGEIQLRRAPRKFLQMVPQFLLKGGIVSRHFVGGTQFLQRRH